MAPGSHIVLEFCGVQACESSAHTPEEDGRCPHGAGAGAALVQGPPARDEQREGDGLVDRRHLRVVGVLDSPPRRDLLGRLLPAVVVASAGAAGLVAAAEGLHRWAALSSGRDVAPSSRCVVVVLGHPSRRDGRVHPIQRWRVEIALRSLEARAEGRILFTGGARRGGRSEAAVMTDHARTRADGGPRVDIEDRSTSTRENVELALAMVDDDETIVFASDPMHAARARRYAVERHPELAERIVGAADYRFMERWWLKVPTAAYELWITARSRPRATPARADAG